MAAQTDAPDDLIAELARLMADDARTDVPARAEPTVTAKPTPVRIPGVESPVPTRPVSVSGTEAAAQQASTVRIPGFEPASATPPAAERRGTPNFDFGTTSRPASAVTPVTTATVAAAPVPAATPVVQPVVARPEPAPAAEPPALDHDSLADLIAAELAGDSSGSSAGEEPVPEVTGAPKGEDNFGVPPVFGFGSSPKPATPASQSASAVTFVEPEVAPQPVVATQPQPAVEPTVKPVEKPVEAPASQPRSGDALADIENLVGSAIHLRTPPASVSSTVAAPSPALRSLATPTLPKADTTKPRVEAASVDDAILAAAAATGARVEWVDPDEDASAVAEPRPMVERRRRPVFGFSRAVAGPVVALVLLLAAGGGLYWMLGQGSTPTGPAPLIAADTTPIKEVPEPVETPAPQSVVFNEIAGTDTGAEEQLVSRDQADEQAVTEAASTAATSTPSAASNVLGGTDTAVATPNQDGLVNRKVRTVTVRPDGTIVSGDESLAGASILPVDRPNVPEVPGADTSTPSLIANTASQPAAATETTPASTPEPATPETPAVVPFEPGTQVAVVDASGQPIAGRTVTTPVQRPADFAQAASAALSAAAAAPAAAPAADPTATTPAATATAAVPAGGTAGAYVQLSSQRSEEAARESARAIATRYGVLFGGANLEIQRVDLGERGIYYRVLVPAADRTGAANICTNVKAAGGDCLIL